MVQARIKGWVARRWLARMRSQSWLAGMKLVQLLPAVEISPDRPPSRLWVEREVRLLVVHSEIKAASFAADSSCPQCFSRRWNITTVC